jgi:hypothetical protein
VIDHKTLSKLISKCNVESERTRSKIKSMFGITNPRHRDER